MNKTRQLLSRGSGQAMVEFALLAPAFFLLLLGVLDFGRAGLYFVSTVDLARQTARYAAAYNAGTGFTSGQVGTYIQGQANATGLATPTLISTASCARPTAAPTLSCQKPTAGQTNYWLVKCTVPTCNPETVTITVIYAFRPTTPIVSNVTGTIYLYADSVMIKEYNG